MTKTRVILVFCALMQQGYGQEWPHYGADPGGMRYSPLDQINRGNVTRLKVAWTYRTGDMSDGTVYPTRSAFECTPIVVDGVMYISTPFSRVDALDPESGKELWNFDPKIDKKAQYNLFINRGVAFWGRGGDKRVFVGTLDGRLFALNAADGKPVHSLSLGR
jgi:quinoprotein glucose dehydrogenase